MTPDTSTQFRTDTQNVIRKNFKSNRKKIEQNRENHEDEEKQQQQQQREWRLYS